MVSKAMSIFCASLLLAFSLLPLRAQEQEIRARMEVSSLRVQVGEEVSFSAEGSSLGEGSEFIGFFWDFNDMDEVMVDEQGETATHVFNRTGAYTVRLTVENDLGERDEAVRSIEVMPNTDTVPSITDNFQGGRTGVFFDAAETFAFRLEWGSQFYFRIDNGEGREVSLRIVGYGPNRGQLPSVTPYSGDTTFDDQFLFMYSTDYQNHDWKPLKDCDYSYDEATATLTASFVPPTGSIYLAWATPWTLRNLEELIERYEDDDRFFWRTIGMSVEGRPIYALTVTDFRRDDADKKAVWITGAQHAYEMASGPVTEGIVSTLLENSDSADAVLENYVYNIVPLMNPDGVCRGGYRYNMHDVDLNRNWDSRRQDPWDRELSEPEVAAVKRVVDEWVERTGRLDLFFDFHCLTAIARDLLMIKAAPDSVPAEVKREQDRFVSDFLQKRWYFRVTESLSAGNGNGYIGETYAARTGVISFTPEHCLGYIRTAEGEPQKATPELFRRLGRDYVWLIRDYFASREQ